ncbi:DNA-binding response regulator KdpE [Tenacibaculum sp. 190524A02b]|uniref:Response regulatory domain-containing protein n=1 Tax=Tenacibaculum vairaonense TaxID=3137860 RepID=A0ABM9PH43_9FLAO
MSIPVKLSSVVIAHSLPLVNTHLNTVLNTLHFDIKENTNSGIKALKSILINNPDVAILDANLPYLNAIDIIKITIRKELTTKFIVICKNNNEYLFFSERKRLKTIAIQLNNKNIENSLTTISASIIDALNTL